MINLCAISRALGFLFCALLLSGNAWAAPAGIITHLSGTLAAMKADGSSRILSVKSQVESGDTLSTEKDTYARIKFTDGGEMVLRPNTVFKVDSYGYDENKPKEDGFAVSMMKGGARIVSGMVGKRNRDAYAVKTTGATIGIRGTDYGVLVCRHDCKNLKDGTYTHTYEGIIHLSNKHGELDCGAGDACYASEDAPPAKLHEAPGDMDFFVPASFLDRIGGDTVLDRSGHTECRIR